MNLRIESGRLSAWRQWIPRRYLIALLSFLGTTITFILRSNMSLAIVAMTSNHSSTDANGTTTCQQNFAWSSTEKGLLLGSFYYGFMATQLAGGIVAPMIGARRLLGSSVLLSAVLSLAIPMAASYGLVPVIMAQATIGLAQGVVFPAVYQLWCQWGPPLESTLLLQITYSGCHIGTFICMALSGWVADTIGWSWIFYISSGAGVLWCVVWFDVVRDNPSEDEHISAVELEYLSGAIVANAPVKVAPLA